MYEASYNTGHFEDLRLPTVRVADRQTRVVVSSLDMTQDEAAHAWIEDNVQGMIELQRRLTAIPALAPENGGDGEADKATFLVGRLRALGVDDVQLLRIPDDRVSAGYRPAVIATLPGMKEHPRLWIMSHLDVVPPGAIEGWDSDPYQLQVAGGRIVGRGVEDNQQGLVSSVFASLALRSLSIKPAQTVKLLFVADEEVGSVYGIRALLESGDQSQGGLPRGDLLRGGSPNPGLFERADMFLVPDGGNTDGTMVEIAEKSIVQLEFTTRGKQCHASTPDLGTNALLAGAALIVALDSLHESFPQVDELFDPPRSTFVPTRRDANVPNVNTLPGEDRFCVDMRILPQIDVEHVVARVAELVGEVEARYGVRIETRTISRVTSRRTPPDAPIVERLNEAISRVHGRPGRCMGMGGGTVAAYLRDAGYDTVVWSTIADTAHMPNEYCLVENMKNDALVMASLMIGPARL